MITRGEVGARLRIVRYGVITVIVITFVTVLVAPFAFANQYLEPVEDAGIDVDVTITDFLQEAVLAAVIALVLGLVVYVGYYYLLKKQLPMMGGSDSDAADAA